MRPQLSGGSSPRRCRTEYICPADLPDDVAADVRDAASRTYSALGCTGFARVDLMLDTDGRPDVLEANAIPGLTDTSLFPMAADAAGIGFEELVSRIIELAVERRGAAEASRT